MLSHRITSILAFTVVMLCTTKLIQSFRVVAPTLAKQPQVRLQMRMMSVLSMRAKELSNILNDASLRSQYQIVDVRESDELRIAALPDKEVLHLPLSESNVWAEEIIEGKSSLNKEKATICVCHHGMRSKRMADFLGTSKFLCHIGRSFTFEQ